MILITRPRKDSLELQKKLKKIKIDSLIQELSTFKISKNCMNLSSSIILITSTRSIDYLVRTNTLQTCKCSKFLVIGNETSKRLKRLGCKHIIVTAKDSKDLLEKSKRVLEKREIIKFLCSNIYNKQLVRVLKKMSYDVKLFQVYETHGIKKLKKTVINNLKKNKLKAAVFFSQFSLKIFFHLCQVENIDKPSLKRLHYICISKRVAKQAIISGFKVHLANEPTKESILKLVQKNFV
tara:strand:- start:3100 stop:3810 length:711 start_codon:yes stop_codon:yes gene_type:complete